MKRRDFCDGELPSLRVCAHFSITAVDVTNNPFDPKRLHFVQSLSLARLPSGKEVKRILCSDWLPVRVLGIARFVLARRNFLLVL